MKVFKLAAITAAFVALAGCKTEFTAEVPLSALQDAEVAALPGTVRLEVPSCNHYEDSRQPSDSVVKAQEMMPRIFPDAEFAECYSQNMDSWAEFNIQFPIDRDGDKDTFASDSAFNITTSENLHFGISAPPALIERLEQARRAEMMMPEFEYAFAFNVINDTEEPFPTTAIASWIDGHPSTIQGIEVPAGEQFTLRLSDVLIDRAVQTGAASILVDFEALTSK